MMPIYEFHCGRCDEVEERIRSIAERDGECECGRCGDAMVRIVSVPTMNVWNDSRPFHNMSPHGDGTKTFPSKAAYEAHLKDIGAAEVGIRAPIKRAHGTRLVGTWR